jgi:hypothetical protein
MPRCAASSDATRARIDRKRKKKGSNDEWKHPHDPDAKITKMKDGRTRLAHKADHARSAVIFAKGADLRDGDVSPARIGQTLRALAERQSALLSLVVHA